jgi:Kef-type K+ transport system membrane component KefB
MYAGLDAIFGAFLIGVILPRDEALVKVVEKIEDIVMVVFLPMVSQGFEVVALTTWENRHWYWRHGKV